MVIRHITPRKLAWKLNFAAIRTCENRWARVGSDCQKMTKGSRVEHISQSTPQSFSWWLSQRMPVETGIMINIRAFQHARPSASRRQIPVEAGRHKAHRCHATPDHSRLRPADTTHKLTSCVVIGILGKNFSHGKKCLLACCKTELGIWIRGAVCHWSSTSAYFIRGEVRYDPKARMMLSSETIMVFRVLSSPAH